MNIQIETQSQMRTRMAMTEAAAYHANREAMLERQRAADAILGRQTVEHIVMFTDAQGRAKYTSRVEGMAS